MTLKWLVAAAVTASVPLALKVPPEPSCGDPAGRVDGIKVADEKRDEVDRRQMSVDRGGSTNQGRNGMPLCFGDLIVTGAQVTAILRLDAEPDTDRTITLSPNTTTELTDSSSIFLKIGRLFVSLHGRFDIKTVFARLGARGTEFDVTVTRDAVDVVQLEGTLDVVPTAPAPAMAATAAPDSGPSLMEMAPSVQPAPMQLERLTRATIGRRTPPRLPPVDEALVRQIIDTNSSAILITRPATPSENVIDVYDSAPARAVAYREARFRTVWSPDQKEHFQRLGDVYHDWVEADKALLAYSKAADTPTPPADTPRQLNAHGNVLRLTGALDGAEKLYQQAIALDPLFAFPYNGLGDVYRDRSLAALDKGQRLQAYEHALKSRDFYQQSLDPSRWGKEGGPNRAVALYNLGEILRQLGDIQASEPGQTDFSPAKQFYVDADKRFQEALAENGQSPFAQVGRARVKISEAGLYQIGRRADLSKQALDQAQSQLERTIATFPRFAVARQTLGDALDQSGQRERAVAAYSQATQLDPQNATAYFKVASVLERLGRTDQARPYYGTYARVEKPIFRGGTQMAKAERVRFNDGPVTGTGSTPTTNPSTGIPTGGGSPNARLMVPSLTGFSRSDAEKTLKAAGLAVGRTTVEPSPAKRDSVIGQRPEAGQPTSRGTKVDLVIAGPEKSASRVPDLIGDTRKDALKEIASRHFRVGQIRQQPSCESVDKVLAQDPPKDARLPEQTSINLVVSSPGDIRVPDLRGRSQAEAERMLRSAGLVVTQTRPMETAQLKPGSVVRVDPKPGTMLAKGCGVTLIMAIEVPRVSVPNFVGMTLEQAKQRLPTGLAGALADFKLGTVTQQSVNSAAGRATPVGVVVSQDPKAGTMVPKRSGTPINLVVSAKDER